MSYNSEAESQAIQLEMDRGSEQTFYQRRHTDGQQTHEKMLDITNHQGNATQNHSEISLHTCQNCCYQKDKKQVLVMMWRKENPCTLLVGMQIGAATIENSIKVSQKNKNRTPI